MAMGGGRFGSQIYHTHPNPQFGKKRDAPLFVIVPGGSCKNCPKKGNKK